MPLVLVKDIMNYMPQMKYMFANVAATGGNSDPAAKRMKLSWPELMTPHQLTSHQLTSYPYYNQNSLHQQTPSPHETGHFDFFWKELANYHNLSLESTIIVFYNSE